MLFRSNTTPPSGRVMYSTQSRLGRNGTIEDEHADLVDDRRHASVSSRTAPGRSGKAKTVGVLEKKANTTYIGGEVVIGKEAKGDAKVGAFTYPIRLQAEESSSSS